jgi:hypothetical protein
MTLGWQIVMPPFNFDLGDAGKGPSGDWAFWTTYNAERATGKLEVTSTQRGSRLHRGGELEGSRAGGERRAASRPSTVSR